MSSVWHQAPDGGWQPAAVRDGEPLDTDALLGLPGARFVRFGSGPDGGTGLLVKDMLRARVNGLPVPGGFRVLAHKDEVLLGTTRVFFSSESKPAVVPFRLEAEARTPTCPVCRGPIRDGDPAVRCPDCGRWYHQAEAGEGKLGKPCWTYAPTCRFCPHPTSLSGDPVWRPELEEAHG